jgi:hypothetical protein
MELRIATDKSDFPETGLYWVEQLVDGEWLEVFGTFKFTAGEAWEAIVTPAEIQTLFQGERRDITSRTREKIWSNGARAEYAKQTGEL